MEGATVLHIPPSDSTRPRVGTVGPIVLDQIIAPPAKACADRGARSTVSPAACNPLQVSAPADPSSGSPLSGCATDGGPDATPFVFDRVIARERAPGEPAWFRVCVWRPDGHTSPSATICEGVTRLPPGMRGVRAPPRRPPALRRI